MVHLFLFFFTYIIFIWPLSPSSDLLSPVTFLDSFLIISSQGSIASSIWLGSILIGQWGSIWVRRTLPDWLFSESNAQLETVHTHQCIGISIRAHPMRARYSSLSLFLFISISSSFSFPFSTVHHDISWRWQQHCQQYDLRQQQQQDTLSTAVPGCILKAQKADNRRANEEESGDGEKEREGFFRKCIF